MTCKNCEKLYSKNTDLLNKINDQNFVIQSLIKDIDGLKAKIETNLLLENKNLLLKNNDLTKTIQNLTTKINTSTRTINRLNDENDYLKDLCLQKDVQIYELENQTRDEVYEENEQLKEENKQLKEKNSILQREISSLKQRIKEQNIKKDTKQPTLKLKLRNFNNRNIRKSNNKITINAENQGKQNEI